MRANKQKNTPKAFSIIEVLIGIFVFSLGLVSIYALLASSLRINDYNNNAIIASNLAREQVELYRNIRDTNYQKLQVWNQYNLPAQPTTADLLDINMMFLPSNYFTLENNYTTGDIDVENKGTSVPEGPSELGSMQSIYGLCLDTDNRYIYSCQPDQRSIFHRYLYIEKAKDETGVEIDDAFVITSKVIWYKRGYHEYEIKTIVTDWRRI